MKRNAVRYYWKTRASLVELKPSDSGRYAAADDVAGGHTFMPSDGTDLGTLGIPHDLSEWHHMPSASRGTPQA